jgi:hypothetical protein
MGARSAGNPHAACDVAGTGVEGIEGYHLLGYIVSARPLVGIGFPNNAYSLYEMTQWTPYISESTVVTVGFIQGLSKGIIESLGRPGSLSAAEFAASGSRIAKRVR